MTIKFPMEVNRRTLPEEDNYIYPDSKGAGHTMYMMEECSLPFFSPEAQHRYSLAMAAHQQQWQ